MKQEHNEISVWDLLIFIKSTLSSAKRFVFRSIVVWVLIFAIFIILVKVFGKKYKSEMYVSAKNMNRQELTSQIVYLNSLIVNENYNELSTCLKISEEDSKTLRYFDIEPYVAEKSILRTTSDEEPIKDVAESKITLVVVNNSLFDTLNTSLINYLNNSMYSELMNTSAKYQMQTLINTYSSEIMRLDSIENKKSSKYNVQKQDGVSFLFDGPSEIAKARIGLIEKIAQTSKDLKTNIGVKVIKQFYTPSKPQSKFTNTILVVSFAFLVLFTCLFLALFEIVDQKVKEYVSNSK